jgi:hypothetical protein
MRWRHVNAYGTFTLSMQERLRLSKLRSSLALLCRNRGFATLGRITGKKEIL